MNSSGLSFCSRHSQVFRGVVVADKPGQIADTIAGAVYTDCLSAASTSAIFTVVAACEPRRRSE
jgi:hypothetical protein